MRGNVLSINSSRDYLQCADCGGLVDSDSTWQGEDERGRGSFNVHHRCEDCGRWATENQPE